MEIIRTVSDLAEALASRREGDTGFVPTMGALHAGHISLVEKAEKENGTVVVSIFVNPTQFNDPKDLIRYPRTPEADIEKLRAAGADIIFIPEEAEVYPEPDIRRFDFGEIEKVMEGATRPGHFNGVAQVVSKLFDMVKPRRAYFGEKDFQQIAVIRALVRSTGSDIEIITCPIVREPDGLAMSSRNELLTPEHRDAAPIIYQALKKGAWNKGRLTVAETEELVRSEVEKSPLLKTIYFNIVDADTLQPVGDWGDSDSLRGCIAVQAGSVRLIDNIRY